MYSIWSFVLWGLRALAAGAFPQARHTGAEWLVSDEVRESLAGKPLGFRGALVQIRADWAEIANSMGMRNWNHVVRPCPFCKTPKAMLATTTGGFGPGCEPGEPAGPATYEAECRMSEIVITLSKRDRDTLLPLLAYSFTRRNRYLVRDLPDWNLAKCDVLQPGHDLWDIGQLEYVEQFPCRVVFWRQRDDAMVLHRFPLFDLPLGISLDTICIDQMHTLNLGVYQAFCLHSLWVLIKANVWRVGAHLGDRDSWALSCEHIRGELTAFYKRMKTTYPDLSEIPHFSISNVGGAQEFPLRAKAAQTKWLMRYVVESVAKHAPRLEHGAKLKEAGDFLVRYDMLVDSLGRQVSPPVLRNLFRNYHGYCRAAEAAGISATPKLHLWGHMLHRCQRQGSPLFSATWKDEALNLVLRTCTKMCLLSILRGGCCYDSKLCMLVCMQSNTSCIRRYDFTVLSVMCKNTCLSHERDRQSNFSQPSSTPARSDNF